MPDNQSNLFKIDENPDKALMIASELFHSGKVFIYPTDTIYGIGGDPFDDRAVKRISEMKSRDERKQFIWLLPDFEKVLNYTEILFEKHLDFLQILWPAPVTVILNLNKRTSEIIHQKTIAVRIPQNEFCIKLLNEISRPLISTSVNKTGKDPFNKIEQIINDFAEEVDAIFFSTHTTKEVSSTIIDLTTEKPQLVREGSINFVELLEKFN